MEYLQFILYGLIQGLTEFIPVSSTAHLKIISLLFGIEDPGPSLSAIIQLGSVFALIWYFKNKIFISENLKSYKVLYSFSYKKLLKSILIGTIPIVFFGAIIKFFIPSYYATALRSNFLIAIMSILMSIFMYVADISKNRKIKLKNHNYIDSLLIGLMQSLAIIPGVSRSGITISTALLAGWERKDAAKFSFLLGIPAISIAAIAELVDSLNDFSTLTFFPLIAGVTTAFLSSLFAISFLINYLTKYGLKIFIYYRLLFGFFILLSS